MLAFLLWDTSDNLLISSANLSFQNQDPFPTTTTSGSSSNGIQEFSGATPTCIVAGGESDSEGSISVEIVKPSKRNKCQVCCKKEKGHCGKECAGIQLCCKGIKAGYDRGECLTRWSLYS
ncbi:uncharacterized protein LOC135489233 [Lineus longissimus]|uniref:uncharacterized protein LOC135489233 n=1 Tax=Lineus longissimus TaxID=88925 RepID=UPI00315CF532